MAMAWKERYKYSRRRKRSGKYFNPTHDDIEKAVENFLKNGGQIRQIETEDTIPDHLFQNMPGTIEDDFFLEQ